MDARKLSILCVRGSQAQLAQKEGDFESPEDMQFSRTLFTDRHTTLPGWDVLLWLSCFAASFAWLLSRHTFQLIPVRRKPFLVPKGFHFLVREALRFPIVGLRLSHLNHPLKLLAE